LFECSRVDMEAYLSRFPSTVVSDALKAPAEQGNPPDEHPALHSMSRGKLRQQLTELGFPKPVVDDVLGSVDPTAVFIFKEGGEFMNRMLLFDIKMALRDPLQRRLRMREMHRETNWKLPDDVPGDQTAVLVEAVSGPPDYVAVFIRVDYAKADQLYMDAMREQLVETLGAQIPEGSEIPGFLVDHILEDDFDPAKSVVGVCLPYAIFV
jgi:hypothetical protein